MRDMGPRAALNTAAKKKSPCLQSYFFFSGESNIGRGSDECYCVGIRFNKMKTIRVQDIPWNSDSSPIYSIVLYHKEEKFSIFVN
jgi:hypothetical protein